MNIDRLSTKEILLYAIKSEVESKKFYGELSNKTRNGFLKDKLKFLSIEEEKHRKLLENIYRDNFGEEICLPDKSIIPLPEILITESSPMSELLRQAMETEKLASDIYKDLAKRFSKEQNIYKTLLYLSDMETEHYRILEIEKENAEHFEEADVYNPMVNIGP